MTIVVADLNKPSKGCGEKNRVTQQNHYDLERTNESESSTMNITVVEHDFCDDSDRESNNLSPSDPRRKHHMILIDEQNNAIHSTIHKNISKKLKPFLKEGQLYALSNFEVGTCNEFYRPIQNEHKIIFLPTTNIQELIETEVNIPHHKFEFVDYNTIIQRLNNHVQLSDIIAKVVAIGPIEHPSIKGSNVAMRNIIVMAMQYLTLWGPVANEIDDNLFKRNPGPFIIVATCLIVKTFKGEYNLSSTSRTKIYINLEIPETSVFMDHIRKLILTSLCFNHREVKNDHLIEELPRQFKPQRTIEEEMNNSRRTIIEILNMVWNSENKVPEEFDLPIQIAKLIEKTFVFQLELNDYNLKQGWQIYTVKKVFDPVMQTDNSVKLDQITDYYMSNATNDSDNNLPSEKDANPTYDANHERIMEEYGPNLLVVTLQGIKVNFEIPAHTIIALLCSRAPHFVRGSFKGFIIIIIEHIYSFKKLI
ncbi:replication protein a 70 kda dna-binding subunit b [Quercus suber]|uniref:Replication protein a 70 kDa dna-binding subunit b n=1 Tax=Quercus suber TaxID=58331 RepID=A0AAW0LLF2_QUESU